MLDQKVILCLDVEIGARNIMNQLIFISNMHLWTLDWAKAVISSFYWTVNLAIFQKISLDESLYLGV